MRLPYAALLSLACLAVPPAPLAAQRVPSARAIRRATETITAADMHRRMALLADDSMRGRNTPSPELDQTAAYIAAEFRRLGLAPGGEEGTYIQRYPIECGQPDTASAVELRAGAETARWQLGRELGLLDGRLRDGAWSGPAVLFTGVPADTADLFGGVELRGATVVHVLPAAGLQRGQALLPHVLRAATRGIAAWLIVSDLPGPVFAAITRATARSSCGVDAPSAGVNILVFAVRDSMAQGILGAVGVDVAATLAGPAGVVRMLPGATTEVRTQRQVTSRTSAPNVIGILPGSDAALREEHLIVSAHIDHIGVGRPVDGDSIFNGADDNASGTAAVVEIAEAFARLDPRPRRSVLFLLVSGEEKGLWGSSHYVSRPTVPLERTVANFTLDMISRGWRDSVAVIGLELSSLGEVIRRVAREHPEAGTVPVNDHWPEENFMYRSDHINFASRGVPILYFLDGTHPDYHRVTDHLDRADTEATARIARLVFLTALEVANAAQRPVWDPQARARLAGGAN